MFNGNSLLLGLFGGEGLKARKNLNVVIKKWVNDYKNKKQNNNDTKDEKIAIIDKMLEHSDKEDEEMLVGDLASVLLASADSTQSHLEQSITHLCLYPEVQEVVYNELNQVFGKNEEFSLKKINECHKFRAFIHEVVRLTQFIITTVPRYLNKDVVINLKNSCKVDKEYFIPKHTTVFGNVAGLVNQQPQLDIAHFLDDKGQFQQNSDLILTFGYGKRECIGKNLAMKELYFIIGMLIRRYRFQAPNNDIVAFEKTMCKDYARFDAYKTPIEVLRR